jgi:hypothetical protein
MERRKPDGRDWEAGQKVRIISLTDVDTKEPETDTVDGFKLIGRLATIVEPYMNDYYDCTIRLDEGISELAATYGIPPTLAFLYVDLEPIDKWCSICVGEESLTHITENHTEDWVNLADARQSGEVIYMSPMLIHDALEALGIPVTRNEERRVHVDRKIVSAIVDALIINDPYGDPDVGIFEHWDQTGALETLSEILKNNPERELE